MEEVRTKKKHQGIWSVGHLVQIKMAVYEKRPKSLNFEAEDWAFQN